jgi:hydrogenase expression/formation protein HypC
MCVAIPAKIEKKEGSTATVALGPSQMEINVGLVPEAKIGDWVLVHAGFAITVVSEEDALATYAILQEIKETDMG